MRKIEPLDIKVSEVLKTLFDNSDKFNKNLVNNEERVYDSLVDILTEFETEYCENKDDLKEWITNKIRSDVENEQFKGIIAYYEEYHKGNKLYEIRKKMELNVSNRCPICDCPFAYSQVTLDHILPKKEFPCLSLTPINLVPTCWNCNLRKGSKTSEKVLNPYFHSYKIFDYFNVDIKFNASDFYSAKIKFEFSESKADSDIYIENIKLYNLKEKFAGLVNISFSKLLRDISEASKIKHTLFSYRSFEKLLRELKTFEVIGYEGFLNEEFFRNFSIECILKDSKFFKHFVDSMNSSIDIYKVLNDSFEKLLRYSDIELFNKLNALGFIRKEIKVVHFAGIYNLEMETGKVTLETFSGDYQSNSNIFEFVFQENRLNLIKNNVADFVNESELISNFSPDGLVGTEIVIPLSSKQLCVLLCEGAFQVDSGLLGKINKITKRMLL